MWTRHAHDAVRGSAASAVMVERARLEPGMKVLDLDGCDQEACLALATEVGPRGHVTVIGCRRELLAGVETEARQMGLANLTFRVADAHELPFPDGAFDRVTCCFGPAHLADWQRALREVHRVLKPGGRAICLERAPRERPTSEPGLEADHLASALEEIGFREIEAEVAVLNGYHRKSTNCSRRVVVAVGVR